MSAPGRWRDIATDLEQREADQLARSRRAIKDAEHEMRLLCIGLIMLEATMLAVAGGALLLGHSL